MTFSERWKEELIKNRTELLLCANRKYGIDESKRPAKDNGGWGLG